MDRGGAHWEQAHRRESVVLPSLQLQAVPELRPVDPQAVPRLLAAQLRALQLPAVRPPAALAMRRSILSTRRISETTQRSMPIDFSFSFNSRGFSIHYKFGQILTLRFLPNNRLHDIDRRRGIVNRTITCDDP